jgi:hypothetical protein
MYYTKYRPEKFADIIKPNAEVEAILNQITKGTFTSWKNAMIPKLQQRL